MAKGSAFERLFCKRLSLWWTSGNFDDVFWRSQTSGARATQRRKKGKTTFGQDSDVTAMNPMGQALMDIMVIELKRGYKHETESHAISRSPDANTKRPKWETFYHQTKLAQANAGTPYWMLVYRRDCAREMVYVPVTFFKRLQAEGAFANGRPKPFMLLEHDFYVDGEFEPTPDRIAIFTLDAFFTNVKRGHIEKIKRDWKKYAIKRRRKRDAEGQED